MNQIGNRKRHWISNPTVSESVSLAQNWTQDLHCNVGPRIGNDMTKENGGKISNSVWNVVTESSRIGDNYSMTPEVQFSSI